MAKPDLDDGYLRIAHELFAAIAVAGFNKWEMVVLREIFDQVYGPKKARVARLSPTDVASRAGTYKESIVRAIRTLVAAGVLAKTAEGEYRFIKDYESWRHGDKPRFSPSESTYCRAAKRIKASNAEGNNGALASKTMGNNGVPVGEQMRSPTGTDALPDGNRCAPREVVPPRPPIEERTRDKNLKNLEEGGEGARAPAPAPLDPEYDRIGNLAIDLGADLSWGPWVSNMARIGYPAAWVEDVVRKMAGRGDMSMPLGHAILQRYQKQGGPDKPKGFAQANENHGKTAVQMRPEETRAKIQRPDLPRTPEYAAVHAMWDNLERGQAS